VIRFIKGAIHRDVALPVLLHGAFAGLIVYLDRDRNDHLHLPSSAVPSLSIVVALMLVFRNQTSYDRFWQGLRHLSTMETSIRNLTRQFLACSSAYDQDPPSEAEQADTEWTVRILIAMAYAAKHHLRAEWGINLPLFLPQAELERLRRESHSMAKPEYSELLPGGTRGFEEQGLGLLIQLSIQIEAYIKRGVGRGWFNGPQSSQMTGELNTLVNAYGNMETIHLTPLPVAMLIHMRQVLALFCCVLPFALVEETGWWSILIVCFVSFTLYGIDAIGLQLEDPFGYDRNDIKIDAIVEDLRTEVSVMLSEWRQGGSMFKQASP
jgi:ion channel-forming bestrophin family protein